MPDSQCTASTEGFISCPQCVCVALVRTCGCSHTGQKKNIVPAVATCCNPPARGGETIRILCVNHLYRKNTGVTAKVPTQLLRFE